MCERQKTVKNYNEMVGESRRWFHQNRSSITSFSFALTVERVSNVVSTGKQRLMNDLHPSNEKQLQDTGRSDANKCTLHVCTSCRQPGSPREPKENRPGYILYLELCRALDSSSLRKDVDIQPAACLSICPRPCGIALSMSGAWTYLFGDQTPVETTADVMECLSLYMNSPKGFMARDTRPKSLRRGILGRVPPLEENEGCI